MPMKKKIYIFDIDGTIVNSDSRYKEALNADGSLNIKKYHKTRHRMFKEDTLLPLVNFLRRKFKQGHTVFLCTSRNVDHLDEKFLKINDIPYHGIIAREWGNKEKDWDLKKRRLQEIVRQYPNHNKIFFDDLEPNVKAIQTLDLFTGIKV